MGTPEHVRMTARSDGRSVAVDVDAPFHGDSPPDAPAGSTDRLWEHEVVEAFFLGDRDHYLEIELGPHGHYLALELVGRRNVVRSGIGIEYLARIEGERWRGRATFAADLLPAGLARFNAYAISGAGPNRRHLALHPVPGTSPDFHRLECFGKLDTHEG